MDSMRETIIIIDDDIINLTVAADALTDKYNVFTVPSGKKLFQLLERVMPDLILLDIEMPEMNGYEIIKELKGSENTEPIPVIFLTGMIDPQSELEGLDLGAIDYITKPFSKQLLLKRIEVHLFVEAQKKKLKADNRSLTHEVSEKAKTVFELQNAILKTVAELVECRDSITGGHIERTQSYLKILTDAMKKHGIYTEELDKWDINLFIMSSQLHDVGKISIKDSILMKPSALTDEEFNEMKKHAVYGENIIRNIEKKTRENAFLEYAKILAVSHHEKWDGSGYPHGLKGKAIPLQGRLMAIADVYDALTNDRPYKKAFSHEDSVEIIIKGSGTQFDPALCDIFLKYEDEFNKISRMNNQNISAGHGWTTGDNPLLAAVTDIIALRGGTANNPHE